MKVDATLPTSLATAGEDAAAAEAAGYDGVWVAEIDSDPFLPLVTAAQHTARVSLGTSIAVAFARSPMTLATVANDLHRFSGGRLILGLGSQIRPHIENRFSMPWSRPAARMRELVRALRAIWSCWNDGTPLDFRGEFYRHTLMTPFFAPPPNPHGAPAVYLAGVGPVMTRIAAEEADGLFVHPFTTRRYVDEVTLPAVREGLAAAGRERASFALSLPAFAVTGRDDEELAAATQRTRQQIAFYGSTPAYARVLELHGWGDLHRELNVLSKAGEWEAMTAAVDDEVLHAFAVIAEPDRLADALLKRWGDVVDRLGFPQPGAADPGVGAQIVRDIRARSGP